MMIPNKFVTLRFSGCGHLLPYHLGVSVVFLEAGVPVRAVAGSSAGALAAVCYARMPHKVTEFADRFISQRGNALSILHSMLVECSNTNDFATESYPSLHIAVTKCLDGTNSMFSFPESNMSSTTDDELMNIVRASCTIPPSFHPVDILNNSQSISYPECDGVQIDGEFYVDGGIAAPAPQTPLDTTEGAYPITVSPISDGLFSLLSNDENGRVGRISPDDHSWRLMPLPYLRCKGGFTVKPSIQNLKALRMAMGMCTSDDLRSWYNNGIQDSSLMLNDKLKLFS